MKLLAVVLVAPAFLLQDTPDQTLKKIVDKVQNAKTVRLVVEGTVVVARDGKEQDRRALACTLLVKGKKVRATNVLIDPKDSKRIEESQMRSDGNRFVRFFNGEEKHSEPTYETIGFDAVQTGVLVFMGATHEVGMQHVPGQRTWLSKLVDVKSDGKDGDLETLKYRVTYAHGEGTVKAWYDPRSHRVAKRTFECTEGDTRMTFTETFKEWTLDADIADSEFELPPEKK